MNLFVRLPPFSTTDDVLLSRPKPLVDKQITEARWYALSVAQAAERWQYMLRCVLSHGAGYSGMMDELLLKSLAVHCRIFNNILSGLAAFGFEKEVGDGRRQVELLSQLVRAVAGDWGVVADGASQWLPSRAPVALLVGCLLLRTQPRNYGKTNAQHLSQLVLVLKLVLCYSASHDG